MYPDVLHQGASKFLDGTRISDGATVMFKKDSIAKHPNESAIGHLLSGEPHSSNVTNHCVHVYDVLNIPDDDNHFIIVMPLLQDWAACPFDTIGESVEMFRQLFEVGPISRGSSQRLLRADSYLVGPQIHAQSWCGAQVGYRVNQVDFIFIFSTEKQ